LEGLDHFTFFESLGAELTTRESVFHEFAAIGEQLQKTQKLLVWRINHIDAVSNAVAYILHSLMVNGYVTLKGQRYGNNEPIQVFGITANIARIPRILLSAFHRRRTYDNTGQLVEDVAIDRGAARPNLTRGVYFLQAGQSGNIKIGRTYDLKSRLASLQTGSSEPLKLLAFVNCEDSDPADVEATVHRAFQRYRLHGEWFQPSNELIEYIRKLGTHGNQPYVEIRIEEDSGAGP
jgi:hypothetical protein